jgi:hypothetical protein
VAGIAARLPLGLKQIILRIARPTMRFLEALVFGGSRRERVLHALVRSHYKSRSRRWWMWADPAHVPHFTNHRSLAAGLLAGDSTTEALTRGFLSGQAIRTGDRALDIGCVDA